MTQDRIYLGECSMVLEKNVCSAFVGWNVLQMSISSYCLMVVFSSIFFIRSYLVILSVVESEMLMSPIISNLGFNKPAR